MSDVIKTAGENYNLLKKLQNKRYNISQLAEEVNKSRPVIKKAVWALKNKGLISITRKGKADVCEITPSGEYILSLDLKGVKTIQEAIESIPDFDNLSTEEQLHTVAVKLGLQPEKIKKDFYATLKVMNKNYKKKKTEEEKNEEFLDMLNQQEKKS